MNEISSEKFLEILKSRRSVREFIDADVPEKDIDLMIQAASYAPSGGNLQNWNFLAVRSREAIAKMLGAVNQQIAEILPSITSAKAQKEFGAYTRYFKLFGSAPAVIAVVKKPYESLASRIMQRYNIPYKTEAGLQGVSAAIENLLLMAHVLGYGGCWMTGPLIAKEKLEKILGVQSGDELAALLPIGRYKKLPEYTGRKSVEEIRRFI